MLTATGAKLLDFGLAKAERSIGAGGDAGARLRPDDARHHHRDAALHVARAARRSADRRAHGYSSPLVACSTRCSAGRKPLKGEPGRA